MPETPHGANAATSRPPEGEESFGVSMDLVDAVASAIEDGRHADVEVQVASLHAADIADLLESLSDENRLALVDILGSRFDAEILTHLAAPVREDVIDHLGPERLAHLLSELDSDDAVEVFEDLDEEFQHRILTALPQAYRQILQQSLTYPEDSAGRLMQREVVVVPSAWTIGETIDYMRAAEDLPDDFYDLYVVNPKHRPIGKIPLSRALRTRRPVRLTEIMETDIKAIPLTMDQEEVAHMFRQYGLVSAPVVDEAGRLVGVITVDDIVHIIEEEAEEDALKLSGVSEGDLYSATLDTTRARFPWLLVNLVTAIVASLVIGLFEATIQQVVALAVLMPIVASMGGNAGTQTLAVAVRALATRDLTPATALRFIGKEVLVGAANGILFAVLTGLVAALWFDNPLIGAIIGAAMIFNMIVAGLCGTLIPITLERLGIDPAIASSVFLTTVTDVVGFFTFLGLASLVLL
ncbi:MAG: magnesium transporter [Alphaproteobacteria bacterium]|nr:MAG: magnesium transporter [Alphaproteobacteria bacterium]